MRAKTLLILLVVFLLTGCASTGTKFYFFGVDYDKIKEMNKVEAIAGVVTAVGAHVGGHFLAGELDNNQVEFDGFMTESFERDSWEVNNGGFVLQHGIGLLLTSFERTRQTDFTRGYVAYGLTTIAYPLTHGNKHNDLVRDGEFQSLEYGVFSTIALHNMLRVNWTTDE